MATKNISLNAWEENNETILAFQGEVNSRFLRITLNDNNGPIDLTDKNVQFYAKKPDGTVIFNSAEIIDSDKGIVDIMLTSDMSAVCGIMQDCEIRATDTHGNTLKFSGLNLIIQQTLPDTEIESSSEFTALQEAIASTTNLENHISAKNNPHLVTTEQIGAAKSNHSHDFDDIYNLPNTLDGYGITDAATAEQGSKADTAIQNSEKGSAYGVATLDSNSKLVQMPTPQDISAVPITRTVNNKSLSSDIVLSASDVGALPNTIYIPSKVSDLQNDSGFITSYTETDPTVPSWAKASQKPSYSFSEINNTPTTLNDYGITDAVPISRQINGKALTSDINITYSDVSALSSAEITSGSWTPEILANETNPTVKYSYCSGYYTKVNNIVTVQISIRTSSVSDGSGNVILSGLPFNFNESKGPLQWFPCNFYGIVGITVNHCGLLAISNQNSMYLTYGDIVQRIATTNLSNDIIIAGTFSYLI